MSANLIAASSQHAGQTGKALNITLWILKILAAGMFLLAGGLKLAGAAPMVAMFEQIGIGQWFRYFTGALEVACAVLLLIPGTSAIGAALLAVTMVGAILTHLFVIGGSPAMPIILLLITSTVALTGWHAPSGRRG